MKNQPTPRRCPRRIEVTYAKDTDNICVHVGQQHIDLEFLEARSLSETLTALTA